MCTTDLNLLQPVEGAKKIRMHIEEMLSLEITVLVKREEPIAISSSSRPHSCAITVTATV